MPAEIRCPKCDGKVRVMRESNPLKPRSMGIFMVCENPACPWHRQINSHGFDGKLTKAYLNFPYKSDYHFGYLGAYWNLRQDGGADLVFNGRGNLDCPQCGRGLSLVVAIAEEALEESIVADTLFQLPDIFVKCSSCEYDKRLAQYVLDELLVNPKDEV